VIKSGIVLVVMIMLASLIGLAMPEQGGACADKCGNGPAEALIKERCTVCHNTDRIYSAKHDEAGWTATVDRMIGKGANLNADERQSVIAALTKGICDACKEAAGK
jgi:hypothetical protein